VNRGPSIQVKYNAAEIKFLLPVFKEDVGIIYFHLEVKHHIQKACRLSRIGII